MTVDGGRRSRSQVRSKVLRAALKAIEELGPDRVRVQDIADRAGMSSGHVMYYFGDRDRILVGTLLLSEQDLAERRHRMLAREADPGVAVVRLSRLYLPTGPRDVRWTLWAQTISRPPTDPETRNALREAVDSWSDALARVLEAGVGAGAFRPLEAEATAVRYCRFLDGLAIEMLLGTPGRSSRTWALAQASAAVAAFAAPAA